MPKQVYRVDYLVRGENRDRRSYVYANDQDHAVARLVERFAAQNHTIEITSIHVEHGDFVVGAEDVTFLPPT